MKANAFAFALLASLSVAEEEKEWDNSCWRCIDEGFSFCSADGITGTCHDISCKEDELQGEERQAAYGECTFREANPCQGTETRMLHYAQCKWPTDKKPSQENCPDEIVITQDQIDKEKSITTWDLKDGFAPY